MCKMKEQTHNRSSTPQQSSAPQQSSNLTIFSADSEYVRYHYKVIAQNLKLNKNHEL